MSTVAVQFLTEALTGTMGAHKGQSVRDPPHPNRICLKKDEDFCKPGLLFFCKNVSKDTFFFSFSSWTCGNQGCGDDSKCGIVWFDEVTPLFTLINRLDGCDLSGLGFLLWLWCMKVRRTGGGHFTVLFWQLRRQTLKLKSESPEKKRLEKCRWWMDVYDVYGVICLTLFFHNMLHMYFLIQYRSQKIPQK